MGNRINIGGRIHNTEVGNVALGANEVLDDTKGKKQNVINAETDAELLRLENEKQDNLTFDNTPTVDSVNPVTSGGVYAADAQLQAAIEAILLLIPSAASALNKLADMQFVNSSIATNTATFRGTYNSVVDLHLAVDATHAQIEAALDGLIAVADNNDYCYVQIPVSSTSFDIEKTERYKFNGTNWRFEYQLNNSGFTANQWAAINSGITTALVTKLGDLPTATEIANQFTAITNLIPSEATALNQLADKAYVLAQILVATPAFKGQFTTLADLQAVASPKAGDLGIVRTKDSDGYDVFTFYQYLNSTWNVFYTLSHHPQNKPATTGTTGDYPYNGMGRVVIPKNMVGGVNTLTQDAFEDGDSNPLTNTVFVIQYDFVLGEDIEVPANCVLEFDGGSISGNGTNKNIISGDFIINSSYNRIFDSLTINDYKYPLHSKWFCYADDTNEDSTNFQNFVNSGITLIVDAGVHKISSTVTMSTYNELIGNDENTEYSQCVLKSYITSNALIIVNAQSTNNGPYLNVKGIHFIGPKPNNEEYYEYSSAFTLNGTTCISMENCYCQRFGWCIRSSSNSYYNKFTNSRFEFFNIALSEFNANNLVISNCRFDNGNQGVYITNGDGGVTIDNCSFEEIYYRCVNVPNRINKLVFSNNYVEIIYKNIQTENSVVCGIIENLIILNNEIFCNSVNRPIYTYDTNLLSFVSIGNFFKFDLENSHVSSVYIVSKPSKVFVALDTFKQVTFEDNPYSGSEYINTSNRVDMAGDAVLIGREPVIDKVYYSERQVGTTNNRPSNVNLGYMYFDTSVNGGSPIWYQGNDIWVDATGTPV